MYSIDMGRDKDGTLYVFELNSKVGLPVDEHVRPIAPFLERLASYFVKTAVARHKALLSEGQDDL